MSEQEKVPPEGASDDLRRELTELRGLVEELRTAKTPEQKREVQAEIAEAEDDIEALAKRTGVSAAKIRQGIADAKRAEQKESMRDLVRELLDELIDDDDQAEEVVEEEVAKSTKTEKPAKAEKPAKPDTEPVTPHWSDKHVTELLR